MPKLSIAITGATGYIGSQVLLELLRRFQGELDCRVLVRGSSHYAWLEALPVQVIAADILEPIALYDALRGVDTLFHCAGLVSWTRRFRSQLYDVNVVGTRNVINAALYNGVRRVVMTSSIAAVGTSEDGSPATETALFKEWQRRNGYMEAKHLAELEVLRAVAEGVEVVLLNPGVVIGVDAENPASISSSNRTLRQMYNEKLWIAPAGSTGFVDVRDVAAAHIAAWEKGASGERYIVVGHNLSFRELLSRLSNCNGGAAAKVITVPRPVGMVGALAAEAWSLVTGNPSFIAIESIGTSSRQLVYNNERSVNELGMVYRDLEETFQSILSS